MDKAEVGAGAPTPRPSDGLAARDASRELLEAIRGVKPVDFTGLGESQALLRSDLMREIEATAARLQAKIDLAVREAVSAVHGGFEETIANVMQGMAELNARTPLIDLGFNADVLERLSRLEGMSSEGAEDNRSTVTQMKADLEEVAKAAAVAVQKLDERITKLSNSVDTLKREPEEVGDGARGPLASGATDYIAAIAGLEGRLDALSHRVDVLVASAKAQHAPPERSAGAQRSAASSAVAQRLDDE